MQSHCRKDFDDLGYDGATVFCRSGRFRGGVEFDLRVVTSITEGEPPWCECIFYTMNPDGSLGEAAVTDVSDDLKGPWEAEIDGVVYRVTVKAGPGRKRAGKLADRKERKDDSKGTEP